MPKVQLFRPPLSKWYTAKPLSEQNSVPTGLLLLASTIRDHNHVEVIDSLNGDLNTITSMLDADFVGVTSLFSNYEPALIILEKAKQIGATTIIGGPYVNHIPKQILLNNEFIDFVVVGDGEEALPMLVQGINPDKIPNLAYRKGQEIIVKSKTNTPMDVLFDLENLVHASDPSILDASKPVPIAAIKGCLKAESGKRCSFCSIDHALTIMEPNLVWQQIDLLNKKYGYEFITEAGDTFIVHDFPEKLLRTRPKHLSHIRFRIYASPNQVTPKSIEVLKALNICNVFLGLESINNKILQIAGKPYQEHQIRLAIQAIIDCNMTLHVPFMYGLPGETKQSMQANYEFASELAQTYKDLILISSVPVPIPGSALFNDLRRSKQFVQEYPGDIENNDIFNYQAMVRFQCKHTTQVTYEEVMEMVERTKALVPNRSSSFDINK